MKRRIGMLPLVGLTAVMFAGCGDGRSSKEPALGQVPTISSYRQIVRPIDAYVPTLEQDTELFKALNIVQAKCMAGYGFPSLTADDPGLPLAARNRLTEDPQYGYFDTDASTAVGYGIVGQTLTLPHFPAGSPPAAGYVLSGVGADGKPLASYNGKSVPAGGCAKMAQDAVGGRPPRTDQYSLPDGGPKVPATDPRLVDIDAKWSACMKSKGFTYATPWDALMDRRWRPTSQAEMNSYKVSPLQVATVEADMACKNSTNLVGVVVAIESAYGDQYIESDASALDQFKKQFDARLENAAHIISSS